LRDLVKRVGEMNLVDGVVGTIGGSFLDTLHHPPP
jgi:hypothetical protein